MIATRTSSRQQTSYVADTDSPAILRLKMLEMKIAVAGPLPEQARQSACALIDALKNSIADKPSLSFADAVAKLKTWEEGAKTELGERAGAAQKHRLREAIACYRGAPS